MARARPALAQAVNEILARHSTKEGRKMSYRQAERKCGLAPATIGELAKGNARTAETVQRFARGLQEDVNRLLLLAGFVPEEENVPQEVAPPPASPTLNAEYALPSFSAEEDGMEPDEREWLGRLGKALAKMPPGRERDLWKDSLRQNVELVEAFLERFSQEDTPHSGGNS